MDNNGPHPAPASDVDPGTQIQMNGMSNQPYPMGQSGAMPPVSTAYNPHYPPYPNTMHMQPNQVMFRGPGAVYLSPNPIVMTCPHCQHNIVTQIRPRPGLATHLVAGVLCIVGCCCCFYIPYLLDSLKDVEHTCSNCGGFIGVYRLIN